MALRMLALSTYHVVGLYNDRYIISQSLITRNDQYIALRMLTLSTCRVEGLYNGRIHDQPISHDKK